MERQHRHTPIKTACVALTATALSVSMGACSPLMGAMHVRPAGHAAFAAKSAAFAEAGATYSKADIEALLGSLTYAGNDVSIDLSELYIESTDGRLIIWHDYEIPTYEDVPGVMERESRRCLALAIALYGSTIENTTGGVSPFKSVTWTLSDGHGNNYFSIIDGMSYERTASRPLELFPQADGYVLSDTIYVAISRRLSGIPPRSGQQPCDLSGAPIVCEGWLAVPDELWEVGMPETSENTDDTGYWYDEEIEIESPSTWYQEFIDQDAAEQQQDEDVVIIEVDGDTDPTNPTNPTNPTDPTSPTDPSNPTGDDPVDPGTGGDPVDPGTGEDPVDPGTGGGEDPVDPGTGEDPVDPGTGGGEDPVDPGTGGGEDPGTGGGESTGDEGGDAGGEVGALSLGLTLPAEPAPETEEPQE